MAKQKSVIEFGTSKIVCMIENARQKGLNVPGISCVRYDGINDGRWVSEVSVQDSLRKAILDAESKVRSQIRSAFVGLPGCFSRVLTGEGTKTMGEGRATAGEFQSMAKKLIPSVDPGWLLIDIKPLYFIDDRNDVYVNEPINIRTNRLTACYSYIFADKTFVQDVEKLFADLHIAIERFICESHAQAMHFIPPADRDSSAFLVDIGYKSTTVSVIFGDGIMAQSTIFLGGCSINDELERELHTDSTLSESLKRSHVFGMDRATYAYGKNADNKMVCFPAEDVRLIIESATMQICSEIQACISRYARISRRSTPVYITGGGLAMNGIQHFIASNLGRRVIVASDGFQNSLPPIYNTAMSLLDKKAVSVYHLNGELSEITVMDRIKNIFS